MIPNGTHHQRNRRMFIPAPRVVVPRPIAQTIWPVESRRDTRPKLGREPVRRRVDLRFRAACYAALTFTITGRNSGRSSRSDTGLPGENMKTLLRIAIALLAIFAVRPAPAADAALIEAAKKEGTVVWYTTLIVNQIIRPLKDAFEKKYPGVTLQYTRSDDLVVSAKILAEGKAGRVQADVFDGLANMLPLKEAGLAAPFHVPNEADYSGELKDKDGYWVAVIMYVFTP